MCTDTVCLGEYNILKVHVQNTGLE